MSLTEAPQITINTPFRIDESILTGFDYTITPIEYIRTAVGARITADTPPMPARFHAYNDELTHVASDMDIKLISLNEIYITDDEPREFLTFLITTNRYTITPKETLTAEQELNFRTGLNNLLATAHGHAMRGFFITDSLTGINISNDCILLRKERISLPTIYIHVDERLKPDDNLKIVRYIDKCNAFYREQFNITYDEEECSSDEGIPACLMEDSDWTIIIKNALSIFVSIPRLKRSIKLTNYHHQQ